MSVKFFDWDHDDPCNALKQVRCYGVDLRAGSRVRLWPKQKADILDIALAGKVATVEAIERDLDARIYLAVVVDDDPGRDLAPDYGIMRQHGHRFFFAVDEIEPMALPDNSLHITAKPR
jgi:hypothetical protein